MASGMTTREESEEEDPSSADITVRFPLTKGDGDMPERSAFSPAEVRDLRLCVSLSIAYGIGRSVFFLPKTESKPEPVAKTEC